MGKHRYIHLSEGERAQLEKLIRTGRSAAGKQTRAGVLLLSDRSQGEQRRGQEVADAALCSLHTVRRVCARYHDEGLLHAPLELEGIYAQSVALARVH